MFGTDEGGPALLLMRRTGFLHPYDKLGISQEELTLESIYNMSEFPVQDFQSETTNLTQEICGRVCSFDCTFTVPFTLLSPNTRYLHCKTC